MPTCTDFDVIAQYNFIKTQLDCGAYPDTPEVPDVSHKTKYAEPNSWSATVRGSTVVSRTAPEMADGSWFLEPVDSTTLTDLTALTALPSSTFTTSHAHAHAHANAQATPSLSQAPPTSPPNHYSSNSNLSIISSSSSSSPPYSSSVSTKTFVMAGAGCTVIQRGQGHGVDFGNSLSPVHYSSGDDSSSSSPDIFDLDKQSFYADDSSTHLKPLRPSVKIEQVDSFFDSPYTLGQHQHQQQEAMLLDDASTEDVQALMIKGIRDDIKATTRRLGVSTNPQIWSQLDSARWARQVLEKNGLGGSDVSSLFGVAGPQLCQMTLEDFQWRAPGQAGETLHQNLDIIKMASQIQPDTPVSEQSAFFSSVLGGQATPSPLSLPHTFLPPASSPTLSTSSHASSDDDIFGPSSGQTNITSANSNKSSAPVRQNGGGRVSGHARGGKQTIYLWQFLRELLDDPHTYQGCIKWLDRQKGIFKIEDSSKVAKHWGRRKNRPAMNYDKLSRSVRQYYKKGIIHKTELSKRLVYQFCAPYL